MGHKCHRKCYRAAVCRLHPDEEGVQPGLAYTPSDMMRLQQQGIPINTQTSALGVSFDEGYRDLDFQPPAEHMRFADMADLWEKGRDGFDRMTKTVKDARKHVKLQQKGE